jgi:hypothetical protein
MNKAVLLKGQQRKFFYDQTLSKTSKKSAHADLVNITFGSGKIGGHFHQDDVTLGTCDGSEANGLIQIKG